MRRYLVFSTLAMIAASPAIADPSQSDVLSAAVSVLQAQRNTGLDEAAQARAELALAQREIGRLRAELEEAKKPKSAEPPAPAEPVTRAPAESAK